MSAAGPCVVAGVFFRSKGIEVSPQAFNRFCNRFSRAPSGTFEEHVLNEMTDASLMGRFMATSSAGPNPHANTRHGGQIGACDATPVG